MRILETERLILRPFILKDVNDVFEYAKLDTVGPNAGWSPHKNKEETKKIILAFIEKNDVLAIYNKRDKKVIGSIGLHPSKRPNGLIEYELGYVLSTLYEGKGIMTEAVKRVLEYAFLELKISILNVSHFITNDKSRRVIEKNGFSIIKIAKYNTVSYGLKDAKFYILTRDNYIKNIGGNL